MLEQFLPIPEGGKKGWVRPWELLSHVCQMETKSSLAELGLVGGLVLGICES